MFIKAEGGLPVKRFVNSDDVSPGISQILNTSCMCQEFDFLDIEVPMIKEKCDRCGSSLGTESKKTKQRLHVVIVKENFNYVVRYYCLNDNY